MKPLAFTIALLATVILVHSIQIHELKQCFLETRSSLKADIDNTLATISLHRSNDILLGGESLLGLLESTSDMAEQDRQQAFAQLEQKITDPNAMEALRLLQRGTKLIDKHRDGGS